MPTSDGFFRDFEGSEERSLDEFVRSLGPGVDVWLEVLESVMTSPRLSSFFSSLMRTFDSASSLSISS